MNKINLYPSSITALLLQSIGYTGDMNNLHAIHMWVIKHYNLYVSIYPIGNHWEGDVRCCDMTQDTHVSVPSIDEGQYVSYDDALHNLLMDAVYYIIFNNTFEEF